MIKNKKVFSIARLAASDNIIISAACIIFIDIFKWIKHMHKNDVLFTFNFKKDASYTVKVCVI